MTVLRIKMILVLGAWAGCLDSGEIKAVDAPAGKLSIEPSIVDTDAAPADGKIPVVVQFFQANEPVKLASGTVSVNDVTLPWSTGGYTARVPIVPSGGSLVFVYTHAGTTTQFTYQVPPRPTVLTPMAKDTVVRTLNLMVTYVSSNSFGIQPVASDGGGVAVTGGVQSDTGMAFIDVSGLRPGQGYVGVLRHVLTTPPDNMFQSATVTYDITSLPTPVNWQ